MRDMTEPGLRKGQRLDVEQGRENLYSVEMKKVGKGSVGFKQGRGEIDSGMGGVRTGLSPITLFI